MGNDVKAVMNLAYDTIQEFRELGKDVGKIQNEEKVHSIFTEFIIQYDMLTDSLSEFERNTIAKRASNIVEVTDREEPAGALKYKLIHNMDSERFLKIIRNEEQLLPYSEISNELDEVKKRIEENPLTRKEIILMFNNYTDDISFIFFPDYLQTTRHYPLRNIFDPQFDHYIDIIFGFYSKNLADTTVTSSSLYAGFQQDWHMFLTFEPNTSYTERAISLYYEVIHIFNFIMNTRKSIRNRSKNYYKIEELIEEEAERFHEENPQFYKEIEPILKETYKYRINDLVGRYPKDKTGSINRNETRIKTSLGEAALWCCWQS